MCYAGVSRIAPVSAVWYFRFWSALVQHAEDCELRTRTPVQIRDPSICISYSTSSLAYTLQTLLVLILLGTTCTFQPTCHTTSMSMMRMSASNTRSVRPSTGRATAQPRIIAVRAQASSERKVRLYTWNGRHILIVCLLDYGQLWLSA